MKHLLPFGFHRLDSDSVVAVSSVGDYIYLKQSELIKLVDIPGKLSIEKKAELQSKFFLSANNPMGTSQLMRSRIASKKETITDGQSLHIIVPTLQCEHSCQYCQVSRQIQGNGYSMSFEQIDAACNTIFQSQAKTLTIEFQGGDPLLRFDLIQRAIERVQILNKIEQRKIRFVIASSLHQLTPAMCEYLLEHDVYLSTSLDGPAELHNKNRPIKTRDSYQRTLTGIELARRIMGPKAVSALMTTTKSSLAYPEAIVDEYVTQKFNDIFIRPLSLYGFAKRSVNHLGYSHSDFATFYTRTFERVLYWNRKGVDLRESTAALILNKILSPFDAGYVDLQSPSGAGLATLVYNYDGYVYPSDEARMLAETGDTSLRLGCIGDSIDILMDTPVMKRIVGSSISTQTPECSQCAFNPYCGPDPIGAQAEFGAIETSPRMTEHCKRNTWLFDFFFRKIQTADKEFLDLAYLWAQPIGSNDA